MVQHAFISKTKELEDSSPSLINSEFLFLIPMIIGVPFIKNMPMKVLIGTHLSSIYPKQGVEVVQYWINHEQGQKSWAQEFKLQFNNQDWFFEILKAQILHEKPDVIYNSTLTVMPYKFIEEIKSKLTKKILWISYYGVPRRGEFLSFDQYDFYLTGFRELEFELNNENQISFFFPHYFDN